MQETKKPRITGAKSMALLGAMLGAIAPTATVSPAQQGANPEIQQARTQNQNRAGMSQGQTVTQNQNVGIDGGGRAWAPIAGTDFSTFPAWNQRKARNAARRMGRKVNKRYYK